MKANPKLEVKDVNFSKKVITFSILFPLFFIISMILILYTPYYKSYFFMAVWGVLSLFLLVFWWTFPRRCSKDGLTMKYQKTEQHFGYKYRYYKCPNGHTLKKAHIQSG
ncbi:MAG: hypothetical protein Q7S74_06660 [Nanoarchaeota archaeon]|nr:hypothetical protein [Nanoarchaeota archaeon]